MKIGSKKFWILVSSLFVMTAIATILFWPKAKEEVEKQQGSPQATDYELLEQEVRQIASSSTFTPKTEIARELQRCLEAIDTAQSRYENILTQFAHYNNSIKFPNEIKDLKKMSQAYKVFLQIRELSNAYYDETLSELAAFEKKFRDFLALNKDPKNIILAILTGIEYNKKIKEETKKAQDNLNRGQGEYLRFLIEENSAITISEGRIVLSSIDLQKEHSKLAKNFTDTYQEFLNLKEKLPEWKKAFDLDLGGN